jgi:protein transport protein SEC31
MRGHDSGVLSLSWCQQDSDLLLSCGKDNRTICWNPQTGQPYGDFPVVTNWTFQTRWNPHNPNLFATASFDGKLSVQSLQNTNPAAAQASDANLAAEGEDFFSKAQTAPQTSSFSLLKAPKWLERPITASFGFGGRIVSVRPAEPGKSRSSKVEITKFEVDSSVGPATDSFETTLQSGDLTSLCESRIANAKSEEEKADWKVIGTLVSSNPRKKIVDYLGFSDADEAADGISGLHLAADKEDGQQRQVNGTKATSDSPPCLTAPMMVTSCPNLQPQR